MARSPITWKNIDAPDFSQAAGIRELAGRRLDKGFESARGVIDDLQTHEDDVLSRNSAEFKNRLLQQFNSPESLGAARDSGQIQALRERFTANGGLDVGLTGRSAINGMIGTEQTRVTADQAFDDKQTMFNDRGSKALIDEALFRNDPAAAEAALRSEYAAGRLSDTGRSAGFASIEPEYQTEAAKQINLAQAQKRFTDAKGMESNPYLLDPGAQATETAGLVKAARTEQFTKARDKAIYNEDLDALTELDKSDLATSTNWKETKTLRNTLQDREILENTSNRLALVNAGATSDIGIQQGLEKEFGFKFADIANNPKALADLIGSNKDAGIALNDYIKSERSGYQQLPSNDQLYKEFVQTYMAGDANGENAMTRVEAEARANTMLGRVQETQQTPSSIANAQTANIKQLAQLQPNNGLIQFHASKGTDIKISDLFEPGKELTPDQQASMDTLIGYSQGGFIPANSGLGNKTAWPLTPELAKYVADTTKSTGSSLKDFFSWGTKNAEERLEDVMNKVYDADELAGFESYIGSVNELNADYQKVSNPTSLVQDVPNQGTFDQANYLLAQGAIAKSVSDARTSGNGSAADIAFRQQSAPINEVPPTSPEEQYVANLKAQRTEVKAQAQAASSSGSSDAGRLQNEYLALGENIKYAKQVTDSRKEVEKLIASIAEIQQYSANDPNFAGLNQQSLLLKQAALEKAQDKLRQLEKKAGSQ